MEKEFDTHKVVQAIQQADLHSMPEQKAKMERLDKNKLKLLDYVRSNIIGSHEEYLIKTVYGDKPLVYSDYTASGKPLKFIEDYIQTQIMPMYANTHTLQSGTGKQTNNAREESRQIIKRVCNATEDDALVFVGNGCTSAVNLLVSKLRVQEISITVDRLKEGSVTRGPVAVEDANFCKQNRFGSYDCILCKTIMKSLNQYESHSQTEFHKRNVELFKQSQQVWTEKPVVFMTIYEHNSNVLPWREAGAIIELVPLDDECALDYDYFEKLLLKYKDYNSMKIAAISAGSNITGTLVDVDRVAVLCHQYSTIACFDYAAVIPYVSCNMNGITDLCGKFPEIDPKLQPLAYKDAVYFSPHKLLGGPGSSGILIAKKKILYSKKPGRVGGGIVMFVNELDHEYVSNVEELEEAGTPGIIQDIRTGLAFQLKESINHAVIIEREEHLHRRILRRLLKLENVFLLGNNTKPKVCIYSFLIKSKFGKFLNPQFVVSLLNDLFGIQSRAGCQCASMYGQKILGLDLKLTRELKEALFDGHEVLRVGYTRVNLNFFLHDDDVDYIVDAIEFIASYGWMFLPHYQFEPETGYWANREEKDIRLRSWLGQIDYSYGEMRYQPLDKVSTKNENASFIKDPSKIKPLKHYIGEAKQNLVKVVENYKNIYGKSIVDQTNLIPEPYQKLIWFLFPSEVLQELLNMKFSAPLSYEYLENYNIQHPQLAIQVELPFYPKDYTSERFDFEFSPEYLEEKEHDDEEIFDTQELIINNVARYQLEHQRMVTKDFNYTSPVTVVSPGVEQEEDFTFGSDFDLQDNASTDESNQKIKKAKLLKVPRDILSFVGAAMKDFDMIKDGDRVLVALSGGKDSLCLVHILRHFQSVAPIKFEIGAVTVDPQVYEYNPRPLLPYMQELGVKYFIESDAIVERAKTCMQKNSICAFCSRMKRGMIYSCARREGFNVIAMGQHLDDLAESFVMSMFHNGYLRTMKANYTIDKGDLRVIRPLVYCRETLFKDFSKQAKLPLIADNCPACFSAPKERHRIKLMLAQQENLFPSLFQSILKGMMPLMRKNMKDILGQDKDEDEDDFEQEEQVNKALGGGCCQFTV